MATSGNKRGGAKTGGRQPGTLNRKTALCRAKLADAELSAEHTVEMIRRGATFDVGRLLDATATFDRCTNSPRPTAR